ncbi:MAG: hypothetical protein ACXVCY_15365 [Pseudobdellovibrionaceae bacterium]
MKNLLFLFLFFLFSILNSPYLFAFEIPSGLTPPSQQKTLFSYSGVFHESSQFPQGRATTSYQAMSLSSPVYKSAQDSVTLDFGANELSIKPAQNDYSELYDIKFGLGYTRAIDDQRLWSISTRYGSSSDKPFSKSNVTTFGFTALYSFPDKDLSRWLLLIDYSNNRPIFNNLPLPGFAYFYQPSKEFRGVFGVPFASINWQFAEPLTLEVFTLVPWIFKGSVNYKLTDVVKLYSGLDFSQVTYYLADRQNEKDRLFYDEKKLFLGIKFPLSAHIFSEFEMGHSFDRALFIAENYTRNPNNPVNMGNAFYGKLSIKFLY